MAGREVFFLPVLNEERRDNIMIQISKDEAKLIRNKMPNAPIKRTVHKYYVEENPCVKRLIKQIRQKG